MAVPATIQLAGSGLGCKVHPVVVFSILDHFKRRNKDADRVIGCLLGERVGTTVFIKNCFPELGSSEIDMEYHNAMLALHKRVNPKDLVVGWYLTGATLTTSSAMVHDDFRKLMAAQAAQVAAAAPAPPPAGGALAPAAAAAAVAAAVAGVGTDPLVLTVDTELKGNRMSVKAFTQRTITVAERVVAARFELVPLEFHSTTQEKIGVDALISSRPDSDEPADPKSPDAKHKPALDAPSSLMSQLEALEVSMSNLWDLIDTTQSYVSKVVDGKVEGKASLGRAITHALSAIPHFEPQQFAKLFNENIQDLLMIVYLANLTRTQIGLADKLHGLND